MLRKGQATSAATLIAIITGLILLYILLIPPGERDKLLGDGTTSGTLGGNAPAPVTVLLREKPGTILTSGQKEVEHTLPSFNLFTKTEDLVIKNVDSLKVESARGTTNSRKFLFNLESPENTDNAILSFDVTDRHGRLIIRINGEEILNEELKGSRVLNLNKAALKESNEIEFATYEVPFWQFWSKNYYDMKNIKIIASVSDISNRDATESLFLTQTEAGNIERASIVYFVECSPKDVGKLSIYVNGARISSTIPDCGQIARYTVNPEELKQGTNEIRFSAEKGTYLIDRLMIRTQLKEALKPLYYFEVSPQINRQIVNNTMQAVLVIQFVDDNEEKIGVANVNGHRISFDTRQKATYTKDISANIREGNNYVQIEPKVTLNIAELRVELRKK